MFCSLKYNVTYKYLLHDHGFHMVSAPLRFFAPQLNLQLPEFEQ